MFAPIKLPTYTPSEYAYTGLEFAQLPSIAQHYLANVARVMPPALYNPEVYYAKRSELAVMLFRSLQGLDMALVERKLEAQGIARHVSGPQTKEWFEENMRGDEERLNYVLNVLLPERQVLLDEFVIKFDALVWLEIENLEHLSDEATRTIHQEFRDTLCKPLLDHTSTGLLVLNEAATEKAKKKESKKEGQVQTESTKEDGVLTKRMVKDIKNLPNFGHRVMPTTLKSQGQMRRNITYPF